MIKLTDVSKLYRTSEIETLALEKVNLEINKGEFVSVMGPSGCGKSTLLNIIGLLDTPTTGVVEIDGIKTDTLGDASKTAMRNARLGFVFQDFNLLDTFSLQDNIFLPLVLAGKKYPEMKRRLTPLAQTLGIEPLLDKYPYEVSGGQKQRCAVARALITQPQIVLADEPTGALDSRAADGLMDLFAKINAGGQTVLMVTHSTAAASRAGRVLFIRDGRVYHQLFRENRSDGQMYRLITETLTRLADGGERLA